MYFLLIFSKFEVIVDLHAVVRNSYGKTFYTLHPFPPPIILTSDTTVIRYQNQDTVKYRIFLSPQGSFMLPFYRDTYYPPTLILFLILTATKLLTISET